MTPLSSETDAARVAGEDGSTANRPDADLAPADGGALPDAAEAPDASEPLDAAEPPDAAPSAADAAATPSDGGLPLAEWHRRADVALQFLLLHYYDQPSNYLKKATNDTTPTGYWIFAQGLDAVLDGVERTGGNHYQGLIETFFLDQTARGFTSSYFDDENWMALALLRAYDLTGDVKYRTRAEALFQHIETGWDTTCCGANPGGIWWDANKTQKATASNAGPVITGVRLYEHTGNASYLAFAKQVFDYWSAHMVNPSTAQVADHIDTQGNVVWWKFTYNEGLMIGACLAMYGQSHDPTQLALARRVASFMETHEVKTTSKGPVLFDGTSCGGDCAQFKGIGYRYLAALEAKAPGPALSGSAEAIWSLARSPNNLFAIDWAGPPPTVAPVEAAISAAQALNVWAQLQGPDPSPAPTTYEAEEAVLHHLGLEAGAAGFEGWGYIAGWNADGQWIDFHVDVPNAGLYDAELRFAAGAGDASRQIYVNGKTIFANEPFASTGAWSSWSTHTVRLSLAAGQNTISVIYATSLGSTGFLNLDRLKLTPAP